MTHFSPALAANENYDPRRPLVIHRQFVGRQYAGYHPTLDCVENDVRTNHTDAAEPRINRGGT